VAPAVVRGGIAVCLLKAWLHTLRVYPMRVQRRGMRSQFSRDLRSRAKSPATAQLLGAGGFFLPFVKIPLDQAVLPANPNAKSGLAPVLTFRIN